MTSPGSTAIGTYMSSEIRVSSTVGVMMCSVVFNKPNKCDFGMTSSGWESSETGLVGTQ